MRISLKRIFTTEDAVKRSEATENTEKDLAKSSVVKEKLTWFEPSHFYYFISVASHDFVPSSVFSVVNLLLFVGRM
jgi:hypothetical protein